MKLIWFISYNLIFYPLIFVIGLIFSLFNSKFRQGVAGRFRSQSELKKSLIQYLIPQIFIGFMQQVWENSIR